MNTGDMIDADETVLRYFALLLRSSELSTDELRKRQAGLAQGMSTKSLSPYLRRRFGEMLLDEIDERLEQQVGPRTLRMAHQILTRIAQREQPR